MSVPPISVLIFPWLLPGLEKLCPVCLNHLEEPVFIAVSKPLLTEFGIHLRLESCDPVNTIETRYSFQMLSTLLRPTRDRVTPRVSRCLVCTSGPRTRPAPSDRRPTTSRPAGGNAPPPPVPTHTAQTATGEGEGAGRKSAKGKRNNPEGKR